MLAIQVESRDTERRRDRREGSEQMRRENGRGRRERMRKDIKGKRQQEETIIFISRPSGI